jgi:hypothetical protein
VNRLNGFSDLPKIIYETTNIRDNKELLEELGFLCGKGILGYEDLCVIFDYNLDSQIEKRKFDWKNRNVIAPVYEESQGLQPKLDEAVNQDIKIKKETQAVKSDTSDIPTPKNNQTKTK